MNVRLTLQMQSHAFDMMMMNVVMMMMNVMIMIMLVVVMVVIMIRVICSKEKDEEEVVYNLETRNTNTRRLLFSSNKHKVKPNKYVLCIFRLILRWRFRRRCPPSSGADPSSSSKGSSPTATARISSPSSTLLLWASTTLCCLKPSTQPSTQKRYITMFSGYFRLFPKSLLQPTCISQLFGGGGGGGGGVRWAVCLPCEEFMFALQICP